MISELRSFYQVIDVCLRSSDQFFAIVSINNLRRSADSILVSVDITLAICGLSRESHFRFNLFRRWPLVVFDIDVWAFELARSVCVDVFHARSSGYFVLLNI